MLGYSGICALLYFKQRDLVYYPAATRVPAAVTNFNLTRDGVTLRGWKLNPGKAKALVYFGGNAERLESSREEFTRLFPGRTIYLLSYRGYGASDGKPTETALFGDALTLYDAVRAQHPAGDIAVIGRSLGSGVASYVASRRPVHKLVLITPFDSLTEVAQSHYRWLPVRWLISDAYASHRYLQQYSGPLLILRAGRDEVIPPDSTDRLVASLKTPPTVVDFPLADHNDISLQPRYGESLREFILDDFNLDESRR
ncbi:MAG TPA: alpha/beta fold hydrolase [Pseudoxanthomonas sp.]|nr:alpha/beta fold hydrolase [Pseudoxanthomonas sp.]